MADKQVDPRPDRQDRPHQSPETGKNQPYPAPGGAGTGTKGDPTPSPVPNPSTQQ